MTVESFSGSLLVEPWKGVKADGTPYLVFTPFWKQVQKHWQPPGVHAEPRELDGPARWPASMSVDELGLLPDHDWSDKLKGHWSPGELGARRRLEAFAEQALDYHVTRDRPDRSGTSCLSPHLHSGEVSPGQIVRALEPAGELPTGKGRMVFASELAWREFSHHLLWHFRIRRMNRSRRPSGNSPGASAQTTLMTWPPGSAGEPASRWWMPACVNCGKRAGCTTACA